MVVLLLGRTIRYQRHQAWLLVLEILLQEQPEAEHLEQAIHPAAPHSQVLHLAQAARQAGLHHLQQEEVEVLAFMPLLLVDLAARQDLVHLPQAIAHYRPVKILKRLEKVLHQAQLIHLELEILDCQIDMECFRIALELLVEQLQAMPNAPASSFAARLPRTLE
jgi:hypothetical protein